MASAVILAGGASTRMQTNKALIELFAGQRMIDYVIGRLQPRFKDILLVTNDPELYTGIEARIVTDHYPRKGPLSGIHAGLMEAQNEYALVTACDMPFISLDLVDYMLGISPTWQAVVPVYMDRLQSLCAVYHRSVALAAEQLLLEEQTKLRSLFSRIHYRTLSEEEIAVFGEPSRLFTNVNTRDSLDQARNFLGCE